MRSASLRFADAALWPLTVWGSLSHFDEHAADDYVERTSPIVASAIAFWLGAATIALLLVVSQGYTRGVEVDGIAFGVRVFNNGLAAVLSVLLVFLPVVYAIGLWLFATRDERYPR